MLRCGYEISSASCARPRLTHWNNRKIRARERVREREDKAELQQQYTGSLDTSVYSAPLAVFRSCCTLGSKGDSDLRKSPPVKSNGARPNAALLSHLFLECCTENGDLRSALESLLALLGANGVASVCVLARNGDASLPAAVHVSRLGSLSILLAPRRRRTGGFSARRFIIFFFLNTRRFATSRYVAHARACVLR